MAGAGPPLGLRRRARRNPLRHHGSGDRPGVTHAGRSDAPAVEGLKVGPRRTWSRRSSGTTRGARQSNSSRLLAGAPTPTWLCVAMAAPGYLCRPERDPPMPSPTSRRTTPLRRYPRAAFAAWRVPRSITTVKSRCARAGSLYPAAPAGTSSLLAWSSAFGADQGLPTWRHGSPHDRLASTTRAGAVNQGRE